MRVDEIFKQNERQSHSIKSIETIKRYYRALCPESIPRVKTQKSQTSNGTIMFLPKCAVCG